MYRAKEAQYNQFVYAKPSNNWHITHKGYYMNFLYFMPEILYKFNVSIMGDNSGYLCYSGRYPGPTGGANDEPYFPALIINKYGGRH